MAGGFRYLDHMTDAVIEAHGDTIEECFEFAAMGLNDTMIDLEAVEPKLEVKISATGHDEYSLLFDWLDKVMLLLVADGLVMSEFRVKIATNGDSCYSIEGIARGEKLDLGRHHYKVEIKAVTYHEMQITRNDSGVTVRFLLDL
ncbi:MAG TPA: archease [Nitrososphaera sp.]|nr:archease [Nitrososphaera sp.]